MKKLNIKKIKPVRTLPYPVRDYTKAEVEDFIQLDQQTISSQITQDE